MIAIISDVHGNFAALSAVLKLIDQLAVDEIICLGDIGGYYCQVNECCDEIRNRKIFSLMGNHDLYLTSDENCPRSNSANICIDYQKQVLSDANRAWLSTLTPKAQRDNLSIVHGGWNDPVDEYVTPSNDYFSSLQGTLFASGHTHVPTIWNGSEKTYCNPGSVGQPRDGDPRASFATLSGDEFKLWRVNYDVESIQRAMHNAGFSEYFYSNLTHGTRIGGKIDTLSGQNK